MSTDEAEVLQVYDAHDRVDRLLHVGWPPLMDWIREHGADPNDVRRVEVLLLDCPLVSVPRGHPRRDRPTDDAGELLIDVKTRDVLLRRDPSAPRAVVAMTWPDRLFVFAIGVVLGAGLALLLDVIGAAL